jgi:Tfp pilus assembly protein PilF
LSEAALGLRYAWFRFTGYQTMSARFRYRSLLIVLTALLLTACSTLQPAAPPVSENPAVLALFEQAHSEAAENKLQSAAATVERALRIEPRNPWLWQELARLHLEQGDPAQAESLAARSNTWAGNDRTLRAANWRLIGAARTARGDSDGAQAAEARAVELER